MQELGVLYVELFLWVTSLVVLSILCILFCYAGRNYNMKQTLCDMIFAIGLGGMIGVSIGSSNPEQAVFMTIYFFVIGLIGLLITLYKK